MSDLRQQARGRNCQVRLPCCNGDSATVVLAHFRLIGVSGIGLKPPDAIAAWSCSACHSWIDTHKDDETQLAFARGCFRTQAALIREGFLRW